MVLIVLMGNCSATLGGPERFAYVLGVRKRVSFEFVLSGAFVVFSIWEIW